MKKLVLKSIRIYKSYSATKPCSCRFTPSCSDYASEAIEQYGTLKGAYLSVRRILRCNPLGSFGLDPVPEKELG